MIRVHRGPEPPILASIRTAQLTALRALGRVPSSDDVHGYRVVAEELWRSQHHKCCYCESRIPKGYNDVEHYRPKAVADRRPGCASTHGYWWLAFTWSNLLFACPDCNRSHKNSRFPLEKGCRSLLPEDLPPGDESPLLIDPSSPTNPVEHIEFVYQCIGRVASQKAWWARPRNGSVLGNFTIEVCGLNRPDLREVREDHYVTVIAPHAKAINAAIALNDILGLRQGYDRALELLTSRNVHVGLNYDALRFLVPQARLLTLLGVGWPTPDRVAP